MSFCTSTVMSNTTSSSSSGRGSVDSVRKFDEEQDSISINSSVCSGRSINALIVHRRIATHGLSNTSALINLVKGLVGTGILSMAAGYANAGLWVGTVLTFVITYLNVHCMTMLVRLSQHFCVVTGQHRLDYLDIAELTVQQSHWRIGQFARSARVLIIVCQVVSQLGFCCAYVAFISQNIQSFVAYLCPETHLSIYVYIAGWLVPTLLLILIRELKHFAPIAMISNLLFLACFLITFQYLFRDLPPVSDRAGHQPIGNLPLFFGIVMFAFEAVNLILPIENKMLEPKTMLGWNGVLNTAAWIVCSLYVAMGFFGYLKFGEAAKVKGTITLNLPSSPVYLSVRVMVAVAVFISYALQFYVPIELWRNYLLVKYPDNKRNRLLLEYVGRYGMALLTFGLAAAVPHVDLFISLIGSLTGSCLALIFPPLLDICWRFNSVGAGSCLIEGEDRSHGRLHWRLWKNVIVILIGLVGLVTGTYSSLREIIQTFQ